MKPILGGVMPFLFLVLRMIISSLAAVLAAVGFDKMFIWWTTRKLTS